MVATLLSTRERLLIMERACLAWQRLSRAGAGWRHNLDLSWCTSYSWKMVVSLLGKRLCEHGIHNLDINIALFNDLCSCGRKQPWVACRFIKLYFENKWYGTINANALFPNTIELSVQNQGNRTFISLQLPDIQSLQYLSLSPAFKEEPRHTYYMQQTEIPARIWFPTLDRLTYLSIGNLISPSHWRSMIDAVSKTLVSLTDYGLTPEDITYLVQKCPTLTSLNVTILYPEYVSSIGILVSLTHLHVEIAQMYIATERWEDIAAGLSHWCSLVKLVSLSFSDRHFRPEFRAKRLLAAGLNPIIRQLDATRGFNSLQIVNGLPVDVWLQNDIRDAGYNHDHPNAALNH